MFLIKVESVGPMATHTLVTIDRKIIKTIFFILFSSNMLYLKRMGDDGMRQPCVFCFSAAECQLNFCMKGKRHPCHNQGPAVCLSILPQLRYWITAGPFHDIKGLVRRGKSPGLCMDVVTTGEYYLAIFFVTPFFFWIMIPRLGTVWRFPSKE